MATDTQRSVKLRIVADAGTAKQTLDDIASKADSIDGKKSSVNVGVNSGTTKAQLDEIAAKAEALGITNVRFTVKADTASANKNLDETKLKASDVGKSFLGASAGVIGFGDAATAASSDSSMFAKVLAGVNLATGLFEPLAAGAIVAVGGLASGLVAAGAGLGVFGLVAKGAFAQVTAADTANKKLTGGLGELQVALKSATSEYDSFISKNAGGVANVVSKGLGLLPTILKAIQPLLAPVESALTHIIGTLSSSLNSGGLQSFIKMLAANTGPAIEKIATAIGHVVVGLGGIIEAFMPMSQTMLSGLDTITKKFEEWGQTLSSHTGFQSLMSTFKTETPLAVGILKNLATVLVNVGSAMTGLSGVGNSKALLQVLEPLSGVLAKLSQNQNLDRIALYLLAAADAGKKLSSVFTGLSNGVTTVKTLSSGISTAANATKDWGAGAKIAAAATKVWSGVQAAFNVIMDANPIALIVIGIAALVTAIVLIATKTRWFQDAWDASWGAIKSTFDTVFNWIKSHWALILDILTGPIGIAATFIISHWNDIVNGASHMVSSVINFMASLPGRIIGAVSSLASDMYNIGSNIIWGIIHGVESAVGTLFSYISNVASSISSVFSSVLSIFSPSRVFFDHGKNIILGLIGGLQQYAPQASETIARLGQSLTGSLNVSTSAGARAGAAARGGTVTIAPQITVAGIVGDAGSTGREIGKALNEYLRQAGQEQLVGF